LGLPGGRRLDECPEKLPRERAGIAGSLGMPLHAEDEGRAFGAFGAVFGPVSGLLFDPFESLDGAIEGADSHRLQLVAHAGYGLVMA
jgi:hypothetical protein